MDSLNRDFAPNNMTDQELDEMFNDPPVEAESSDEQNEVEYWDWLASIHGHELEFVVSTG